MKIFIGAILVLFGGLLLLEKFGIISYDFWGSFLPIVLIVIGLKLIIKKNSRKEHECCGHDHEHEHGMADEAGRK